MWLTNKIKRILNIKDKPNECEYCGSYFYGDVIVIRALPPFESMKQHFCCKECQDRYIDSLLPEMARKYND